MKMGKTKHLISWIIALSLALMSLVPFSSMALATGTTVSIGTPATVIAGSTFVANVSIGAVTNLRSYQFDLSYNNSVIQVSGTEGGGGVTSGMIGSTSVPLDVWAFMPAHTPGVIRVIGSFSGVSSVSGDGYLVQVHFNVVGTAGQSSNLILSNVLLYDTVPNPITATVINGAVLIVSGADTTPPTINSVNPANNATGVAVSTTITAVFSESMSASTINTSDFTLMNGSTPVTGTVNYNEANKTATFTPSTSLANGATYTAAVTTGVTDLAGNHLAGNYIWSFTIAGSTPPPQSVTVSIGTPATVSAGANFDVNVNISNVTNFNAYEFDLTYNNSVIQATSSEGGNGVTAGLIGSTAVPLDMWAFVPQVSPGKIRVLGHISGAMGITGSGYLAQVHFHVVGAVGQSSNLTPSNVMLYDAASNSITSTVTSGSVTVINLPLEITTATLSEATAGKSYSANLIASGGQNPYSWSATGLPAGLTISGNGTINGTPTASGDFNVGITVADAFSPLGTAGKTLTLHVYAALQINTASLPDGRRGAGYTATMSASGGKGSYTWSATGLPAGLTMAASGGISSIPTVSGDFNVNVTATDAFNPANSISASLPLKIILPGDANGDGSVTMADVTKTERIILGLDPPTPGADANGDGNINMGDVTCIELLILRGS